MNISFFKITVPTYSYLPIKELYVFASKEDFEIYKNLLKLDVNSYKYSVTDKYSENGDVYTIQNSYCDAFITAQKMFEFWYMHYNFTNKAYLNCITDSMLYNIWDAKEYSVRKLDVATLEECTLDNIILVKSTISKRNMSDALHKIVMNRISDTEVHQLV